jgi:hypothetical protein
MHANSASLGTGASMIRTTSSDESTASFKSSDMMLPSMASGKSGSATATAPLPGTASLPVASECLLGDETVRPEVLAKVVLQARLRESNSRRELEREQARTKALEALVQQLAKELREVRKAVARQAGHSSGQS